ncbi:hypothetical protein [Thermocrinis sp.]
MKKVLYLSTILMLVSISLFEGLVIALLLYTFYLIARGDLRSYGRLFGPLVLYTIPTLLSTISYTPSQIGKGIERSVFLLVYPLGGKEKLGSEFFGKFNKFFILCGVLLMPVVLYNYYKTKVPAPIWGGVFEVGLLYAFFSISALSMFLYTKRKFYFLLFLLFMGFVFLSMRRSAMMGLAITLIIILYMLRGMIPKKTLFFVLSSLTLAGALSFTFLVERDPRFSTMVEVVLGEKSLNDQTLDTISSIRWQILKAGLEVVKRDLQEGNYLPLLIGHGINSGYYLEPRSPVGGVYESVFLLSEFIEKGFLGLLGILWLWWSYYSYILRFRPKSKEDFLVIPCLCFLSISLIGSVFTFFWDAMLPWMLLTFRIAERYLKRD